MHKKKIKHAEEAKLNARAKEEGCKREKGREGREGGGSSQRAKSTVAAIAAAATCDGSAAERERERDTRALLENDLDEVRVLDLSVLVHLDCLENMVDIL